MYYTAFFKAILLHACLIRILCSQEPLQVSLENASSFSQAIQILADYHDVSYGYEEDIIPPSAYCKETRYRLPVALSFTLMPDNDLEQNLEIVRKAIESQTATWNVSVRGYIISDVPVLIVVDDDREDVSGNAIGLSRSKGINGAFDPDTFVRELAKIQQQALKSVDVPLRGDIWGDVIVRPRPGGIIEGDWNDAREGALALIKHVRLQRNVHCGYRYRSLWYRAGVGYWYRLVASDRTSRPELKNLGGIVYHRFGVDIDYMCSEILSDNDVWTFVARQRPAQLEVVDAADGSDIEAVWSTLWFGALIRNPVTRVVTWKRVGLKMYCQPDESLPEIMERSLNDDRTTQSALGPIRIIARPDGGHELYFGPGRHFDPEKHGAQLLFAQEIPPVRIEAGTHLTTVLNHLYQALPETPAQPLRLAEGAWQEHILSEGIDLGDRSFGASVIDLFSAADLPPGILRVHYDLSERCYIFTYHEPDDE